MDNKAVAGVLSEVAVLLDLSGESAFKGRAYTNVARQIEQLDEDVSLLALEHRLRDIKGVGDALEKKIQELVGTGALAYHSELRARFPETLFDLFAIPGLGPKRIKVVYDELGIDSLEALEKACVSGVLSSLKGFGAKTEKRLLESIAFSRKQIGLHLFDRAYAEAQRLVNILNREDSVIRLEIAGSLRRRKEIVKDVDLIASSTDPKSVMNRFVSDAEVARVNGHGLTKSSVVLHSGIQADLRVVDEAVFPFALVHFTGSKEHNVVMRKRANERGMKLNEYGLTSENGSVLCTTEQEIFSSLDLPYIPPELREDRGEFDLESTPALVTRDDLIGVFHCHSSYSDGRNTIAEMAEGALERGYKYLTMTDHSQSAAYAGGLNPQRVAEQRKEIERLNSGYANFRILCGIESDVRTDGALDYEDDVLQSFEIVIASVHNKLEMSEDEATRRVIRAIENPYTDILGHPTGRLLLARKGYDLDFRKVFDACVRNNVAIEINANCRRLDLDWRHVRAARDMGVKFSIGPDAHNVEGLDNVSYGVGIARKGWLAAEDILNTMTLDAFFTWRGKSPGTTSE